MAPGSPTEDQTSTVAESSENGFILSPLASAFVPRAESETPEYASGLESEPTSGTSNDQFDPLVEPTPSYDFKGYLLQWLNSAISKQFVYL